MKMPSKVPKALAGSLAALVMLAAGVSIQNAEPTPEALRNEYIRAVAADQTTSMAVKIAMVMGSQYESSGKHIGKPYVDKLGRGQPLTVCNGVTGAGVVAGRYYTPDDCKRLELPRYLAAERQARAALRHWGAYNVWVQASFIDMVYNLGPGALDGTAIARLANAGDLDGACAQMPRWVRGTVAGQKVTLPGLVDRRATTQELCAEWGRTGHFSEHILEAKK